MSSIRIVSLNLLLLLLVTGCSLLSPPEGPVIPTPPPAPPVTNFSDLQLVTDPISAVTLAIDPEILLLVNAVSEQQLRVYVQTLEGFGTRSTFSNTQRDDYGIGAARRWIYNEFLRVNGGALQVTFNDFQANIDGLSTNQRNVIATLPGIGDHPGAIILMAHYDSRPADPNDGDSQAPGANDNGSGVAILLELARLLSSRSWNQTVVFAAFAAEEQGTYGSRFFVQNMMLSGRTFDAAIDNDIVGGRPGISQSIRVFSPGPDTTASRQLARYFGLVGSLYMPAFRIDLVDGLDRQGRFSDHREFINAGVPGIRLTESEEDFSAQHGAGDTSDKIDFIYLRQVAQLNLSVVANLAGAPPPPQVPAVAPMATPGTYNIVWQPNPLAAGYAISLRPLGSTVYPPFRYVSIGQSGNVGLSGLDPNVAYAASLAAIDAKGRIGLFTPEVIIGP